VRLVQSLVGRSVWLRAAAVESFADGATAPRQPRTTEEGFPRFSARPLRRTPSTPALAVRASSSAIAARSCCGRLPHDRDLARCSASRADLSERGPPQLDSLRYLVECSARVAGISRRLRTRQACSPAVDALRSRWRTDVICVVGDDTNYLRSRCRAFGARVRATRRGFRSRRRRHPPDR
jgi:hypothetical protein